MTNLQESYFIKVAELLSFSKAANELYVSQPSVSMQISSLEEELGFLLFDRSNKNKISLTVAGRLLYEGLKKGNEIVNEAIREASTSAKIKHFSARIGMVAGWCPTKELSIIKNRANELYPGSSVFFCSDSFKNLRQKLDNDELDAILTIPASIPNLGDYKTRYILDSHTVIYYSEKHKLQNPSEAALSDFAHDIYYVLPEEETPLNKNVTHAFLLKELKNPTIVECPNRDSVFLELSFGKGFSVFDDMTVAPPFIRSLRLDTVIPIYLFEKPNTTNPITELFVEEMMKRSAENH